MWSSSHSLAIENHEGTCKVEFKKMQKKRLGSGNCGNLSSTMRVRFGPEPERDLSVSKRREIESPLDITGSEYKPVFVINKDSDGEVVAQAGSEGVLRPHLGVE